MFPPSNASLRQPALSKTIFSPRIRCVGITTYFPEPEDVPVEKSDFPDELRALPGVALRNDYPGRTAVIGRQRLAIPAVRDENVVVHADIQRIVRRITIVAFEENVRSFRLRL